MWQVGSGFFRGDASRFDVGRARRSGGDAKTCSSLWNQRRQDRAILFVGTVGWAGVWGTAVVRISQRDSAVERVTAVVRGARRVNFAVRAGLGRRCGCDVEAEIGILERWTGGHCPNLPVAGSRPTALCKTSVTTPEVHGLRAEGEAERPANGRQGHSVRTTPG